MADIVLTTFNWVPAFPRGYVRDLRIRWALEEAELPYHVEGMAFTADSKEHLSHQPFGQVPWITDGDLSIFESGAILLHLGEKSETLMSQNPVGRSETIQWLIAGLNSMEMASVPWSLYKFADDETMSPGREHLERFLGSRLQHLEAVLAKRDWLAGRFSIADILMCDILRLIDRFDALDAHPACRNYVERSTARPAFAKAHQDQLAHFAKAD